MPRKRGPKRLGKHREEQSPAGYDLVLTDLVTLLKESRHAVARSVNSVMTATYWLMGRRIVEVEQGAVRERSTARQCSGDSAPTSPSNLAGDSPWIAWRP